MIIILHAVAPSREHQIGSGEGALQRKISWLALTFSGWHGHGRIGALDIIRQALATSNAASFGPVISITMFPARPRFRKDEQRRRGFVALLAGVCFRPISADGRVCLRALIWHHSPNLL